MPCLPAAALHRSWQSSSECVAGLQRRGGDALPFPSHRIAAASRSSRGPDHGGLQNEKRSAVRARAPQGQPARHGSIRIRQARSDPKRMRAARMPVQTKPSDVNFPYSRIQTKALRS